MKGCRNWEPAEGPLEEPDPSDFDFISDVGFRYKGDGRSLVLACLSISKSLLSHQELFNVAKAVQAYFDASVGLGAQPYVAGRIFKRADFRPYQSRYAYKFVTEEAFDRYVSKGCFLVSSLERFRELEGQGSTAGDRFEGSAHSAYALGGRHLTVSTISGFDCHIFSLAADLKNMREMKEKFGPVVLRIQLAPFARGLARYINSKRPEVRLVRYADLKLFLDRLELSDVAGFPPKLTRHLAQVLRRKGRLPSIFAKPGRFETEREVRIALPTTNDVAHMTQIYDPTLLRLITRVNG